MEKFNGIAGFENRSVGDSDNITYIKSTSMIDDRELTKLLGLYGNNTVTIDTDLIEDDIKRLKNNIASTNNKSYKVGAKTIIEYLEKLKKYGSSEVRIKLANMKSGVMGMPTHLYRFTNYNIQSTDYISVQDKTVVSVKYDNALDAMALAICREDLELSMEDIEARLKHLGMISTYSSNELKEVLKFVNGKVASDGHLYNISLSMMIGRSDYINLGSKLICSYFGDEVILRDKATYQEVLEKSAGKLMKLITLDILRQVDSYSFGYRLMSVNDGLLTFTIDKSVDINSINNILNLGIVLKIFGRKFRFNPDIKISKVSD